ncbi:hypothetical protein Tco_0604728 [Tanacetum coccineum]
MKADLDFKTINTPLHPMERVLVSFVTLQDGEIFSEESDKIEKYVGGLLDMIHGSVMASRRKQCRNAMKCYGKLQEDRPHARDSRNPTAAEDSKKASTCFECGNPGTTEVD